ncbi:M3 family metallopeptidase [Streptomyces sp. NPDC046939]|uniref:M3 family oligoendopeptidase n=1 Tax=Streptomyces sp. NPDC046939 TaxID=3155376 RepID=UPI0034027BFD
MRWDLTSLAPPPDGPAVAARARGCAERWRGRVASLTPRDLARLLRDLGEARAGLLHLVAYAALHQALDVYGEKGAQLALEADEVTDTVDRALRFFDTEWQALPEARAERLLGATGLATYRHLLRTARQASAVRLPERDEALLAAREPLAQAWGLLHDRLLAPYDEALYGIAHPDPAVRRTAYTTLAEGLEPHAATLALAYDTLVADRLATDGLRGVRHPRALSDLDHQLDPATVDHMLAETERHSPLAERWFRHKAHRLDVRVLAPWDERAPLTAPPGGPIELPEAIEIICAAFARVSPEMARVARRVVAEGRIDTVARPGRVSRAFSLPVPSERTCFVLVSYEGRPADVLDLAHELGHAVAFVLAAEEQPALVYDAPTALSEVPACFAELAVLDRLMADRNPRRAEAAAELWLDRCVTTVFRQALITSFEQATYELRGRGRVLDAAALGDLWETAHRATYGTSLAPGALHRLGWMRIPHLFQGRFYNYAYTFAWLAAVGLHARRRTAPASFGADFTAFLRAGGTEPPHLQLARLGLRIDAPASWRAAFAEIRLRLDALTAPGRPDGGRPLPHPSPDSSDRSPA